MKKDLKIQYKESFELETYHEFVAFSMRIGFRWMRYEIVKNCLSIYSLKYPRYRKSVANKEIAKRYERWYKWMKKNNK